MEDLYMNYQNHNKKFYTQKGFYIACFLCLFAILSVVGVQKSIKNQEKEVDKYATVTSTTAPETTEATEHNYAALQEEDRAVDVAQIQNDSSTTSDIKKPQSDASITAEASEAPIKKKSSTNKKAEKSEKDTTVSVINTEDQNQGLTWPINGDILLTYSMDKPIYFTTLGQYKCNPSIVIAGKVGDEVKSACDCQITKVKRNSETGLTITAVSGDYTYIYGQLDNPKVAEGDTIKEGTVIATLAKPTKYYKKEGCNLYFQIKEEKDSVNPLLMLK